MHWAIRSLRWMLANQALRMGTGFLLGTWTARVLGPSDYGVLSTAIAWAALAYPFMELGMRQIVLKEMSRHVRLRPLIAGTIFRLWLMLGLAAACMAACWNILAGVPLPWPVFVAAFLPLTLSAFSIHHNWMEAVQRADVSARNGVRSACAAAVMRLACLVWMPSVTALAWGIATESIVLFALAAWTGHKAGHGWVPRGWHAKIARYMLRRGGVLVLGQIGLLLLLRIDAVMVERIQGRTEAGIYAAATRLSELFYFASPLMVTLMLPKLASAMKCNAARFHELVNNGCKTMAAIGAVSAIVMLCGGKLAVHFLYGPRYEASVNVLMLHCCAALPYFLAEWRCAVLVALDKGGINAALSWLATIINISLNFIWIPAHGALGAASATLIAYIVAGPLATWLLPDMRWLARSQWNALAAPLLWLMRPVKSWQRARELLPRATKS